MRLNIHTGSSVAVAVVLVSTGDSRFDVSFAICNEHVGSNTGDNLA